MTPALLEWLLIGGTAALTVVMVLYVLASGMEREVELMRLRDEARRVREAYLARMAAFERQRATEVGVDILPDEGESEAAGQIRPAA